MKLVIDNQYNVTPANIELFTFNSKWFNESVLNGCKFEVEIVNKDFFEWAKSSLEGLSVKCEETDFYGKINKVNVTSQQFTGNHFNKAVLTIEASELDTKPEFKQVKINNQEFDVIDYKVSNSKECDNHAFIVKMNNKEDVVNFMQEIDKFNNEGVFQRLGVDKKGIGFRIGWQMKWAYVDENKDEIHQIIQCIIDKETNETPSRPLDIASRSMQFAIARELYKTQAKLEYLIEKIANKHLSTEELEVLNTSESLFKEVDIYGEYWSNLEQVNDVKHYF